MSYVLEVYIENIANLNTQALQQSGAAWGLIGLAVEPSFRFSVDQSFLRLKFSVMGTPAYEAGSAFAVALEYSCEPFAYEGRRPKGRLRKAASYQFSRAADEALAVCTKKITLGVRAVDSFAVRAAFMAADCFVEIAGGVFFDPQSGDVAYGEEAGPLIREWAPYLESSLEIMAAETRIFRGWANGKQPG